MILMQLVDFNRYEANEKMYGGTAGRKIGIRYEGNDYILKFPGNLKEQNMKNIQVSYSNSPICEYIGSRIYAILGIPVHETILGERKGKVVTACRDFLNEGEKLYEFDKIKVTYEPHFLDSNGSETNGNGVDLYEILMTIEEHPFLKGVESIKERFWDMFVVDSLIGNPDRNNNNWGIIVLPDGTKRIAPVYDNGNCLNCKWDVRKMEAVLSDTKTIEIESYKGRRCIFEIKGKAINPYHLMESMKYEDCSKSVKRLVPIIEEKLEKIRQLIEEIPVISDIQKEYYKTMIETRYEKVLYPLWTKLLNEDKKQKA